MRCKYFGQAKRRKKLGTKAEVKNLNSIRNVKRAIEFESKADDRNA